MLILLSSWLSGVQKCMQATSSRRTKSATGQSREERARKRTPSQDAINARKKKEDNCYHRGKLGDLVVVDRRYLATSCDLKKFN